MSITEYKNLLQEHGGIGFEKQHSLFEVIGESDWGLDLDTGILSFGNGEKFPIQVLGTYAYDSETWLWGWENSEGYTPENLLGDAKKLKDYGLKHNLSIFTTPEFDSTTTDVHALGIIASAILGTSAYYCGDYGQGIVLLTIASDKIDDIEYNEQVRITTTYSNLISAYELDHREAFTYYLKAKGYTLSHENEKIIATKDEKQIEATFDNEKRVININQTIK